MTSLRDEDMDRIYTFDTGYYNVDGMELNPKVAQKGDHYYEWNPTFKKWNPARSEVMVKEILYLQGCLPAVTLD